MRPTITVSPSIVTYVQEHATKAIHELTKKESLNACDIQAIDELLKLCNIDYSYFSVPKQSIKSCTTSGE